MCCMSTPTPSPWAGTQLGSACGACSWGCTRPPLPGLSWPPPCPCHAWPAGPPPQQGRRQTPQTDRHLQPEAGAEAAAVSTSSIRHRRCILEQPQGYICESIDLKEPPCPRVMCCTVAALHMTCSNRLYAIVWQPRPYHPSQERSQQLAALQSPRNTHYTTQYTQSSMY